jgi:hypothetical protein
MIFITQELKDLVELLTHQNPNQRPTFEKIKNDN